MRLFRLVQMAIAVAALITAAGTADAAMYGVSGNKPQSAANYTRWPGLVDVVNRPSRQQLVWCNGAETFSYAGDIEELNTTLQLFAKIDCPTHTVVLRPGPLQGKYDWEVHIVEGIMRAAVEKFAMQLVRNLDPVLVIHVSEDTRLESIAIPAGVTVQQLSDLRSRYERAASSGTDSAKREAAAHLKALDEDPLRKRIGKDKYQKRVQRIAKFVERLGASR